MTSPTAPRGGEVFSRVEQNKYNTKKITHSPVYSPALRYA